VGENAGIPARLVNDRNEVDPAWLHAAGTIAVTAGASAPEHLVQDLISYLQEQGFDSVEEVELVEEDVRFSLPPELGRAPAGLTTISRT
jgi:4-hydroxy-3-methylbut-2-enyl diphosphate reductase